MRNYRSVRLAAITSIWVNALIKDKQEELDRKLESGLLEELERFLLEKEPILNGVSRNISLKVSFSSIVEMCYRVTEEKKYTPEEWIKIAEKMDNYKLSGDFEISDMETTTSKLYLEDYIWQGLEDYRRELMRDGNKRPLRLSYIIKLVIFAGWELLKEDS
ncbi:hypothetical protein [Enterococcus mundtii]|uniref:hypothetical protein n=1 Tax=Enterococcus mundtii TaxID=53346 RepID=UPI000E033491|nr:hypothetical protein [Enterococcus mundtii]STD27445.1 Uncharacterised protein [Enterococcus mundtii]